MTLPKWENDSDRKYILERLGSSCAVKVCAKTLDEVQFTEAWIEHHVKIFGFEGVFVADNGSTDDRVLEVYDRWKRDVLIFQYKGPHNELHCHPRFRELFDTISQTCVRFAFIDIDERLVRISPEAWSADSSIATQIAESRADSLVPTAWLINKMRSMESFYVRYEKGALGIFENLRMGKPFFPSKIAGKHCEIHNFQYRDKIEFDSSVGRDLFLLHFTQFPERRIMANRNKLISRGIITRDLSNDQLLALDTTKFRDQSFLPLLDEMRWMKSLIDSGSISSKDETDMLRLSSDGSLFFSDERTKSIFVDRHRDFSAFLQRAVGSNN